MTTDSTKAMTLEQVRDVLRKLGGKITYVDGYKAITGNTMADAIDAHLAPREVSDELQGDFAECYISTTGLETLRTPGAGIATVGRVKTAYSHIPLFLSPQQAGRQRGGGVDDATYSQGVLDDGAAILRNGVRMTIDDIVATLNAKEALLAQRSQVRHVVVGSLSLTSGRRDHHIFDAAWELPPGKYQLFAEPDADSEGKSNV